MGQASETASSRWRRAGARAGVEPKARRRPIDQRLGRGLSRLEIEALRLGCGHDGRPSRRVLILFFAARGPADHRRPRLRGVLTTTAGGLTVRAHGSQTPCREEAYQYAQHREKPTDHARSPYNIAHSAAQPAHGFVISRCSCAGDLARPASTIRTAQVNVRAMASIALRPAPNLAMASRWRSSSPYGR